MPYEIRITRQAKKDIDLLPPKLKVKLRDILAHGLSQNPYSGKKLFGDLVGSYSFRLTYKDRIIYSIDAANKIVYIERARTHYGD
ncbi:MAG: type II toxin-antitoxin system YoeB family toxin [Elusimicrobia bacterium]|nr:type II toxin-antitoxin system YoeB family toxin [Elusimicrobiota bacterium]